MLERTTLSTPCLPRIALTTFALAVLGPHWTFAQVDLASHLPETSMSGLSEVLDSAMTGADSIQLRDIVEKEYEGRRIVAAAPKKLQLGGRATYRKEQDIERDDAELGDRLSYSLSLSKALYHWGALKANREIGELNLEIQELSTFETYRILALDVRRQYLQIVVSKRDVELKQKTLEVRNNRLDLERRRLETGNASAVEVYNLELQSNAADLDLLRSENTLQDQVDTLARLVSIDTGSIIEKLPSEVPVPVTLDSSQIDSLTVLFEQGVTSNVSIDQSRKSIDLFQKDLHIARQRNKPKLGVSVGITQFELAETGRNRAEEIFFGGVTITWNIFDSGSTKGSIVSAAARIEQMKHQFESAKSNYLFDLQRAQNLLGLNRRILERDEVALSRARELVEEVRSQISAGIATESSLDNSIISLASQEVRTNRSRSDYHNALANMTSLLGLDPFAQEFIERRTQERSLPIKSK